MFGSSILEEITLNLPLVKSYNSLLTKMTVVLVTLNPITKYPLAVAPVNIQLEMSLLPLLGNYSRIFTCIISSLGILIVSITIPGFHNVMALLGSFFSFVVSVIFPELCYLFLFKSQLSLLQKCREIILIIIGVICALFGTVWSFLPAEYFKGQ